MTRGIFVAGNDASAAELNDCFDQPRARAYGVLQTLTTAVETTIAFNNERFDTAAMHDNAVNNSRITIPANCQGYYRVGTNLRFAPNATGTRRVSIWRNGVTVGTRIAFVVVPSNTAIALGVIVETYVRLAAGDYIEVSALQDTGGNLDVQTDGECSPDFWASWDAIH